MAWAVKFLHTDTKVIGYDTSQKGRSVCAVVASTSSTFTKVSQRNKLSRQPSLGAVPCALPSSKL